MNELVMSIRGKFERDTYKTHPAWNHQLGHVFSVLQKYFYSLLGAMENIKDFETHHCEHAEPYKPENEQIQVRAEDQALIRRKVCMKLSIHLLFFYLTLKPPID